MPSERIQRQIDALLDEAEAAIRDEAWETVRQRIRSVQALDPENEDALNYAAAAGRADSTTPPPRSMTSGPEMTASTHPLPTSFVSGRYEVKRFLGEGGKKRVYLAHDTTLDRDVAFALIKTEGLDDASRQRITREAQAMGRLGDHPNIVTVYDIGEEDGQPYMVLPLLSGGDVEGVIERAEDHKLSIEEAIRIATETCEGLALAHGKGIVHRDLKPGNVWLTENGTAKIGDFGLAVAVDRSRLTQAGMMVGTVGYMPPEQAMGGEVTPQSDLYSLGCMLYEMVAGRPPFVGDESVAIIGQHLNTPPVSPTWHRPDCPPALEALILRLLEKDATKRPGSASEVKQALESVGQPSVGVPTPGSVIEESTHPHDPVYGRTFVGRENEVKQLQRAFDAALSGQGGLMMVVGEPGIGKTAITEQLATYAALRGGKALTGHCYEEGSLSLPYLAFVEAMRTYVIDRDPEGLRSDLGTGAADVARIVSEIRDRLDVQLPDSGEGDDDRYRLLQGVSDFLRNAASVTPLVIVLEDLHWADRGTLDLLLHVARNLQGARLLIVGTYRDVEVDRAHPLSAALAELRRISSFDRLLMRGLSVDDVRKMIQALAQQEEVRESFAQAVHRQTEGNPLFVQEVVRYVVEEGLVKREDGRYQPAGDTLPEMRIPEGLRDVIGKRLERLSLECNRVLASASVIGREFSLDALKAVVDMNEEDLTTALEEAVHLGILQDQSRAASIGFRFEHAFFRQTLYEEIFTPRRLRLHQEVARALENLYASRAKEHAAELAEHFAQSIDPSDLAKAVHYGETAAERAMTVFAFGEAARLLERALEAQAVLDPEDLAKRCDLLVAYAEPLMRVGEAQRADEIVLEEAFGLAETLQDHSRAVNACEQARWALRRYSAAPGAVGIVPRHSLWIERHRARAATPAELIQVELEQATVFGTTGRYGERWRTLSQALESARELQDLALALEAAGPLLSEFETPVKFQEMNRALAPEVLSWGYDGRNLRTALARARVGTIELMWGDRPRAQEL